jgi:hypothetical protein
MGSGLKLMQVAGIATTALAIIVLTGIAVINGFKDSGTVVNATADLFITGLTIFGTFMAVIVLALIGKVIVGLFVKGKGG